MCQLLHSPYAARRAVDPSVTLARVQPMLRSTGVTRIANITGLDDVGLPVVNVVRPNARSNAVSQGKGLDLESAKVSGVMEAIETHCAEHIFKPLKLATALEMGRHHRLPDLTRLPKPRRSRFTVETPILWTEGRDIQCGESMWIPFELVHMNFTVPAPPGSGHFLLSSNGLASGNTLQEAISHGLCEVIERDASALFDLSASLINNRRLDLDSINDPYIQKLIQRMNSAGIAVAFWDISSDVGVASFRCHIMERPTGVSAVSMPACGEGCHPLRAVALLRSLTEAAQARLSAIAGVRDDIGPDMYGRSDDPDSLEAWWRVVSMNRGRRQFSSVPDQECESSDQEIAYLLARLRDVELEQVILVNLSPDDTDSIAVVRVIVSGLEPPAQAECIPGRRAECVQ